MQGDVLGFRGTKLGKAQNLLFGFGVVGSFFASGSEAAWYEVLPPPLALVGVYLPSSRNPAVRLHPAGAHIEK